MSHNVVKAWHYHHVQFDWWYVGIGVVETVLYDNRPESSTYRSKLRFLMGDAYASTHQFEDPIHTVCVRIPPGVLHGLRVLSDEAHLFYVTSETYNPNEEGRFRFDSPLVPHEWPANVLVVENDRRDFEPTAPRALLTRE